VQASRILRHIRALSAGVLLSPACLSSTTPDRENDWTRRAVATLGAKDGYLFVFSPFNCGLREAQIDALNALAHRSRRTGKVLTIGHELVDSAIARRAVTELGITMPSIALGATPFGSSRETRSLGVPLAIAIRDGQVIATLAGADVERIDRWIAWIEHR
jgi:hypothetical protein